MTVKFDLIRGGAISWISYSGSQHSLVNIADEGLYKQQSYYAGKSPIEKQRVNHLIGQLAHGSQFK